MSENKDRKIVTSPKGGILNDLTQRIKLIVRLMGDDRVSPLLKLLPVGTVVYLLFPDLVPGPIDDAAIIWLGSYLFVELCPPEVVAEHMAALAQAAGTAQSPSGANEEIVEGEFWEDKK